MTNRPASQSPFDALYPVAEQQAGYFTAAQARAAGYSQRQLTYYVKTHRFDRVRPGVYRLTHHPASAHEDLFLAWLQVSPQAVISHESALALYELSDVLPTAIHLTISPRTSRRHGGLRLHTNHLSADEITWFGGLPVTTVPRTILDVAASGLAEELVIQAVQQALQRGLVLADGLRAAAERRGGRARRLIRRALREVAT
jgi:predicted transcriptional regulator of viral defense system